MQAKERLKKLTPSQRKKLLWTISAAIAVSLLLGNEGFRKMISSGRQVSRLKNDLAKVNEEHGVLKKELHLLQNDMSYVERLARKELGLIQPGEIEFRFMSEAPSADQ